MDSSQKRDRDRKQRQRRQDKEVRKKDRAEQKVLRKAGLLAPFTEPESVDGAQPKGDPAPENLPPT